MPSLVAMSDPEIDPLLRLPVDDRLELIGRLWDSVEVDAPLPPEVAAETLDALLQQHQTTGVATTG